MDPDPPDTPSEYVHDHLDSLLRGLPSDLTDEQRDRAEAFIRSRASVFPRSEYDIGCTSIIPHRIDTGEHIPHFEHFAVILRRSFRSLTSMFKICLSMMSLSLQLRLGFQTWSWSVNRMVP